MPRLLLTATRVPGLRQQVRKFITERFILGEDRENAWVKPVDEDEGIKCARIPRDFVHSPNLSWSLIPVQHEIAHASHPAEQEAGLQPPTDAFGLTEFIQSQF